MRAITFEESMLRSGRKVSVRFAEWRVDKARQTIGIADLCRPELLLSGVYSGWARCGRLRRERDILIFHSDGNRAKQTKAKEDAWVILAALPDMHTEALITMGDDELLGTGAGVGSSVSGVYRVR